MRKTNLSKGIALLLTSALAISSLTGCGSSSTGNSTTATDAGSTTTATTAETSGDKVTLKLITWTNQATTDVLDQLNAKFTEQNPNIIIEVTAVDSATYPQLVQTRVAAQDVDIIAQQQFVPNPEYTKGLDTPPFQQYIENGDFMDLTGQDFISKYDQNAVNDAASLDGKVYAIPMSRTSYNGMFYNKTMFEENGLEIPQTWDEFINVCETLKAAGIAPITVAGKDAWPVNAVAANAIVSTVESDSVAYVKGLWDGSRKLNDEKSLEIFKRFEQFASYCEQGAMGVDYASVPGRFAAGKTAMLADGAWQAPQIAAANPDLQFGYFPLPSTEQGDTVAQLRGKYDTMFAGSGKSAHQEEILKWMAFVSEEENYKTFINAVAMESTMPTVQTEDAFLNELAPMSVDFQLQFEQSYRAPKGIGIYGGFQPTQLAILGGPVATPEELADLAQSDWDTAIAAIQ